jgi:perosamine synthetase
MIPQFKPYLGEEEKLRLNKCIDDEWITGGKNVKEFARRVGEIQKVKYVEPCCNGTMALFMCLKLLNLKPSDQVIVPDFTFIASANSVILAGGKLVFCDVDKKTFCMTVETLEPQITTFTKAIMPVHIFGQSAPMDEICEFAKKHNLFVVEDAAQGIGVKWNGQPVGSFGDINAMSFYADKTCTCSEGGAVLINNEDYYKECVSMNNQGRQGRGIYFHEKIGWNFRMSDLHGAVGLAQLDKLDYIINRKKDMREMYHNLLRDVKQISFPYVDNRCEDVPFRITILVDSPEDLKNYLWDKYEIQTVRWFYPLHLQPCYKKGYSGGYPNSIWAYEHGLTLPSYVSLEDEQIEFICEKIREYYKCTLG